VLDGESGTVLESYPYWELPYVADMKLGPEGALWIFGAAGNEYGLARLNPGGAFETIFSAFWDIPDGADGTFDQIHALDFDDAGNLYYKGYSYSDGESAVVRRTPDGVVTRVLGPETLYGQGEEVGWLSISDILVSDGLLFVSDWDINRNRIFRIELPPPPTACTNGVDDDGDGLVDFPADKGCLSPEDEGERSFDFQCDNGLDDDSDGATDFPADPRCLVPAWLSETTACDDRADNDGDGHVDWNGGSVEGYPATPDPECAGDPSRSEHPWYCGLGFEVAIVVLPLTQAARRWRKRRAHSTGDGVGSPERK